MKKTTVVVISSLSYTGTTWINCLLGCHPRSFALGPPDRVINLYTRGWEDACRIHGSDCSLWPAFHKVYNPQGNFFVQLAAYVGKDHIIVNNPITGGLADRHLRHRKIRVKHIRVVRDGRAICRSYVHNNPGTDFRWVLTKWFLPAAESFRFSESDSGVLPVRYEDVVRDQFSAIEKFGAFLGLSYPDNFCRFWEFEHHMAAGNAYLYGMIKRFQQGKAFSGRRQQFYENEYHRLHREPERPLFDEKWRTELSREDLFLFDSFAGSVNESWGYTRDVFAADEYRQLSPDLENDRLPAHSASEQDQ